MRDEDNEPVSTGGGYQCPKCHKYFGTGTEAQRRMYHHYALHKEDERNAMSKLKER